MGIELVPFAPEHLPALRRFCERTWARPRSDAYYRWRYLESPCHRALLALRSPGECVALACAFERPYRFGDERVTCLETFDWYCLPALRGSGLGIRVLQRLMAGPLPIVAVGGSADTRALLPRLKWTSLGSTTRYSLPLRGRAAAAGLGRRVPVPGRLAEKAFDWIARAWFRPRPRRRPAGARVVAAGLGPEIQQLYEAPTAYGTLPLHDLEHLRWLMDGFRGVGHFVPLYFTIHGDLRGWALVRIYPTPEGRTDATIVELYAPRPDGDLYTWMVSEAAGIADAFGPERVFAQTSCPILDGALRRNGFVAREALPLALWRGGAAAPPAPSLFALNNADSVLMPYADWLEPAR